MSKALDHPMQLKLTGRYCPECRAEVEHKVHRRVEKPASRMPPVGEYAPEHRPVEQDSGQ